MPLRALYLVCSWRPTFTLSSTVRLPKSRMFWKVRATPMWLTWMVVFPAVSRPSIMTVPRVGW